MRSYLQLVLKGFRKRIVIMGINRQQWNKHSKMLIIGESLGEMYGSSVLEIFLYVCSYLKILVKEVYGFKCLKQSFKMLSEIYRWIFLNFKHEKHEWKRLVNLTIINEKLFSSSKYLKTWKSKLQAVTKNWYQELMNSSKQYFKVCMHTYPTIKMGKSHEEVFHRRERKYGLFQECKQNWLTI